MLYDINPDGSLHPVQYARAGKQPTAMAVSPDGKLLFVANAISNDVTVFLWKNGRLKKIQTISAGTAPSSIAVSSNGKVVIVTNSGSNDITVYHVSDSLPKLRNREDSFLADLPLTQVQTCQTGLNPSSVAITPNSGLALVANTGSNTVVVFAINPTNFLLTNYQAPVPTISPVVVAVQPSGNYITVANSATSYTPNMLTTYPVQGQMVNQTPTQSLTLTAEATFIYFPPATIYLSANTALIGQVGHLSGASVDPTTGSLTLTNTVDTPGQTTTSASPSSPIIVSGCVIPIVLGSASNSAVYGGTGTASTGCQDSSGVFAPVKVISSLQSTSSCAGVANISQSAQSVNLQCKNAA